MFFDIKKTNIEDTGDEGGKKGMCLWQPPHSTCMWNAGRRRRQGRCLTVAWSAMVGGYAYNGHTREALELLFFAIQAEGMRPYRQRVLQREWGQIVTKWSGRSQRVQGWVHWIWGGRQSGWCTLALVHHSEKIANAFSILTTEPGETIRVTKKHRVCSDCHTAIKLVSKITKREIMLEW